MATGTWIAVGIVALDQSGIWVPQLLAIGHSSNSLVPASPLKRNHLVSASLMLLGSHSWFAVGFWYCLRIASVRFKAELQIGEYGTGFLTVSVVVLRLVVSFGVCGLIEEEDKEGVVLISEAVVDTAASVMAVMVRVDDLGLVGCWVADPSSVVYKKEKMRRLEMMDDEGWGECELVGVSVMSHAS